MNTMTKKIVVAFTVAAFTLLGTSAVADGRPAKVELLNVWCC